jgi:hypothetical protein
MREISSLILILRKSAPTNMNMGEPTGRFAHYHSRHVPTESQSLFMSPNEKPESPAGQQQLVIADDKDLHQRTA